MENTTHLADAIFGYVTSSPSNSNASELTYIPPPAARIRTVIIYVVCLLGLLGNGLCIAVMTRRKLRPHPWAVYTTCLAASDTCMLCNTIVYELRNYVPHVLQPPCNAGMYVTNVMMQFGSWCILQMTLERCLAVTCPLKTHALITRRKALISLGATFLLLAAINLHIIWMVETHVLCVYKQWFLNSVFYDIHIYGELCVYFAIPFPAILVLNLIIIFKLRCKRSDFPPTSNQRNTVIMLITVSVTFLVLATPSTVINVLLIQRQLVFDDSNPWLAVAYVLHILNHAINFYLYSVTGRNVRTELKEILKSARPKCVRKVQAKQNVYSVTAL